MADQSTKRLKFDFPGQTDDRVGLSKHQVRALIEAGKFPSPVQPSLGSMTKGALPKRRPGRQSATAQEANESAVKVFYSFILQIQVGFHNRFQEQRRFCFKVIRSFASLIVSASFVSHHSNRLPFDRSILVPFSEKERDR